MIEEHTGLPNPQSSGKLGQPDHFPDATKMVNSARGAMESALAELVEKIKPGLDTGDLLADATTASKALDAQPSGNSRELFVSVRDVLDWYAQQVGDCRRFGPVGDAARADLDTDGGRRARAALAQQGADKVDAELWQTFLKTANQKGGLIVRWYDESDLRTRPASQSDINRLVDAARKEKK